MFYVRIIDENGLFVVDAFVDELTEFTIETPCPSGFYHPKWNGENWVEGGTAPMESPEQEIARLKIELSETDYKIIKCNEYQLAGMELPYDITVLHTSRQALRDRINELELSVN
ncbi:MAG: hypothetical protein PHO33_04195 [Clostridia bacterium]|nr:hypothetical protein [Clostridia bacterium]